MSDSGIFAERLEFIEAANISFSTYFVKDARRMRDLSVVLPRTWIGGGDKQRQTTRTPSHTVLQLHPHTCSLA